MLTKQAQHEICEKLTQVIMSELHLTEEVTREYIYQALNAIVLFDAKQHDYGPGNIAAFGTLGVTVRLNDKIERLKTIMAKKRTRVKNETLIDTFTDIAVYAQIALLLEKGLWPKK